MSPGLDDSAAAVRGVLAVVAAEVSLPRCCQAGRRGSDQHLALWHGAAGIA